MDRRITEVFVTEGRLGLCAGDAVVLSRTGKPHAFFRQTATDLLADDPVDVRVAHSGGMRFDHAVPWNGGVLLGASNGFQYRLSGEPAITPQTVRLDHIGSFPMATDVRPVVDGGRVLWPRTRDGFTALLAAGLDENDRLVAGALTDEVPEYIPGVPLDLTADPELGFLALTTSTDRSHVYVMSSSTDERGRVAVQAWSRWTVPGAHIVAMELLQGNLWLLMTRADGLHLERINLSSLGSGGGQFMDRLGVGTPLAYETRVRLSRPIPRDPRTDEPLAHGRLQLHYLTVEYHDTRSFYVEVSSPGRAPARTEVSLPAGGSGRVRVPVFLASDEATVDLVSDGAFGAAFGGVEWEGTYNPRSRRI
jgi:hypothetical protein